AAIVLLLPAALFAQSAGGIITGTVRDSSSGAIPGAVVQATNLTTAATFDAVTDAGGSYQIPTLVPGRYRLQTMLDGFETDNREVVVEDGHAIAVTVTLEPARITEG